ncbi:G2/M phase-specific E3 ubiquitin-protein ligase [Lampris incognitus]|uniref:G2/M phase-specific E3 ubiquitin-protein ligase n=1 Tax=Lampris incognitus TaxID=2546036 RepID=UPI0024B48305|nr:G2/M phase-specific E3 ubiquitin-protein ligase [Lampris incognitus]
MKRKRRVHQTTPTTEENCCALCRRSENDPDQFGEMVTLKQHNLTVHYFCLLTSCGVYQKGEEHEGIFGFLVEDIKKEIRRSSRLTCVDCKQKGASVGCFIRSCKKKVHFPCGKNQQFIFQFTDLFQSYCKEHSPTQSVSACSDLSLPQSCSVCLDSIEPILSYSILKCPACHASWFHRDCVQHQAHSAGLFFFRCTLCNNKDSFQEEMLRMGIHIPQRDASWELEANAYEELLEVYQHCDAPICVCSIGRKHSAKTGWFEILRCRLCGSRGTHRKCSELRLHTTNWACLACTQAVDGTASLMPRGESPQVGGQRKSLLSKHRRSSTSCQASPKASPQPQHNLQASPILDAETQTSPVESRAQVSPVLLQPPAHSSLVEVNGDQALTAGLALVRRTDFNPAHRLSVSFKGNQRTSFPNLPCYSEAATRFFLKLLVQQIQNSVVFEGPEDFKNLALDAQALREDLYFDLGCLLALSLVHGGPPLHFFSPALYQCLFNFPHNSPLNLTHMTQDSHFTRQLHKIEESSSLEELKEAMAANRDYLELAGCSRPISRLDEKEALVEDLVSFTVITRMQLPLQRFREGLQTLGVFEQVQLFPAVFCKVFCGPAEPLTAQTISELFTVCFSSQEDRRHREMSVITFWRHFLMECDVGRSSIFLQDLLLFATGTEEVPAVGILPPPTLSFLHPACPEMRQEWGEEQMDGGGSEVLFPQSDPSTNRLFLPVTSSYQAFKCSMEQVISNCTHLSRQVEERLDHS